MALKIVLFHNRFGWCAWKDDGRIGGDEFYFDQQCVWRSSAVWVKTRRELIRNIKNALPEEKLIFRDIVRV